MLAAIDSWVFILLVGVAALLRWLANKASASKDQGSSEDTPTTRQDRSPRETPTSDQEQIRKFLEALGQPRTSKPPPPVAPRTNVPPRPVAPVQPPRTMFSRPAPKPVPKITLPKTPSATKAADWLKKIKEATQQIEPVVERPSPPPLPTVSGKSETREPALEPLVEAYAIAPTEARSGKTDVDLQVLLASPSGLRNAIILREIFGPPRSLQPLVELPGIA